jgi:competence protein CoiA
MQLYAFDVNKKLIFSRLAVKQQDYYCIECGDKVRVRGGKHRQSHFYHLAHTQSCHLSSKSMAHIQVQFYLQKILPKDECQLEYRFPAINRIADVVWIKEKIIFEVQCSPISATEIQSRNEDYKSQGFQVVWILHENRFNQWRVTSAEFSLRNSPFYYTNMNAEGKGIIYDQYDLINNGIRKTILNSLEISPSQPYRLIEKNIPMLPKGLLNRVNGRPFCFKGDLLHICLFDQNPIILAHFEKNEEEKKKLSKLTTIGLCIHSWGARLYSIFLKFLLERACR